MKISEEFLLKGFVCGEYLCGVFGEGEDGDVDVVFGVDVSYVY